MNYSFSITTKKGDEYRIMLIDADISMLAKEVRDIILENNLDITLSDDPENWIKVNEGDGGYAASVEIDGQLTIKGSDLRYYLGLKSNKYTVEYNSLP